MASKAAPSRGCSRSPLAADNHDALVQHDMNNTVVRVGLQRFRNAESRDAHWTGPKTEPRTGPK